MNMSTIFALILLCSNALCLNETKEVSSGLVGEGAVEIPIQPVTSTISPPTSTTLPPITTAPPTPPSTTTPSTTVPPSTTTLPPLTTTPPPSTTPTTKPTTTISPKTSTEPSPSSTFAPTTTAPPSASRFDAPSFIGGIVLCSGLTAISFVGWKYYKARSERNYRTL